MNDKLLNNSKIAVVGLGYVGLPLSLKFAEKFKTIGYDINSKRISMLKKGYDDTLEVSNKDLKKSNIIFTTNLNDISKSNIFIITVPTPIDKYNNPNMKPLALACKSVSQLLKQDDIVIYESTVYPGATEEFCVPILEEGSKLKYNSNFFCGYSPERINPGDKKHTLSSIIKVTSGSNKNTADTIDNLYKTIIPAGTHKASSIAVAEAAKVIENVQRDVNIALINELSVIFDKLNLDTNEILNVASTKWNFLSFKPGLVGGHCIGVDPYYLTHKSIEIGYHPEMILAGRRINDSMGQYIALSTLKLMSIKGINPNGAKVAVLGITFKEDCPDLRNTKVPDIINNLNSYGCEIIVSDPYANFENAKKIHQIKLTKFSEVKDVDVVIIAVSHKEYHSIELDAWKKILNKPGVLIDIKSVYSKNYFSKSEIAHWRL